MNPYVHCCIIYDSQDMEAAQVSINRRVDKKAVVHIYNGILLEWNLTTCNSMDGPGEHYAKGNKPGRERQIPYDFIHRWNLKNNINEQTKCKHL